ncbi:MAG: glycosyltransferase [Oscillospiraceae bacterium]|nr:glycosyltransferase [Oscillospiraceae bacterium]MBR0451000.1 glycosyltransferase [Oscillospiraceae bacterium]
MDNKEKSMVSAIFYLGSDAEQTYSYIEKACELIDAMFEHYEIIAVNDCEDRSAEYLKLRYQESDRSAPLTIVNMSVKQGVECAMNAGIDIAIGDYLFEFDNINSGLPAGVIMDCFRKSAEGYDIVTASPREGGTGTSKLFYRIFNRFSHSRGKIGTDGMHLLSRRAVNRLHAINSYIPYRKAAYAASGLRTATLNYDPATKFVSVKDDRTGKAIDALILYTDAAYRLSLFISLFMFAIAAAAGIYTLVVYLSLKPVAGWTTSMAVISAGFSGMFLLFAIVIKYLSLLVNLVFQNQKYLVASVDKVQHH